MNEQELLNNIKLKQPEAFRELVETYQDYVRNVCFHFLNNSEDAEDTAQDVFVEIYKSIHNFKGDSKLSTWIYRIAVSKSLDLIRKQKRKKRFAIIKDIFDISKSEKNKISSQKSTPIEIIEQSDRIKILHNAINTLSENQRVAIVLNKLNVLSYKETAEVMGISISSVESLVFRAKKNLEKKLHKVYEKIV